MQTFLPTVFPWTLNTPMVDLGLHTGCKALTNPALLKTKFYWFVAVHPGFIPIFTDGSKDKNAVSSAAVCGKRTDTLRLSASASVFTAEAYAICLALQLVETLDDRRFIIFSDSLSCLQSILHRKWQQPIICKILEKLHLFSSLGKVIKFCWVPSHIGILGNEAADQAARSALCSTNAASIRIPHSDFKHDINAYFIADWQTRWNDAVFNKLREIKPLIGNTKVPGSLTRRDEVVYHRMRIGHTHLTHSYLLKRETAPDCAHCGCLMTVKHILLDCPLHNTIRCNYFTVTNLYQLFNAVQPLHIINYLKEIDLYSKI
jgi:kelch-like protein 2/3